MRYEALTSLDENREPAWVNHKGSSFLHVERCKKGQGYD